MVAATAAVSHDVRQPGLRCIHTGAVFQQQLQQVIQFHHVFAGAMLQLQRIAWKVVLPQRFKAVWRQPQGSGQHALLERTTGQQAGQQGAQGI